MHVMSFLGELVLELGQLWSKAESGRTPLMQEGTTADDIGKLAGAARDSRYVSPVALSISGSSKQR
jgi:hypothetical protein